MDSSVESSVDSSLDSSLDSSMALNLGSECFCENFRDWIGGRR